jgi:hypothetical protein
LAGTGIKEFIKQHFTHQSESPLGDVLASRVYAFRLNELTSLLGGEVIELGPHQLQCKQVRLSQQELQHMCQTNVLDLGHLLTRELLLDFGLFQQVS